MKTKIETYEDMSSLDNDTLDRIINHEREAFGYRGYGEYSFCSNSDCRRILSIDEIYGTSDTKKGYKALEELEKDGCNTPDCPDCESPTILIFNPEIYRPYLSALYRDAYGSLLEDEEGYVRGTCVIQKMTLKDFFANNMNYKESMEWDEFRERASRMLNIDFDDDSSVISTNRVSVARPFRSGGAFMDIARATMNIKPENDDYPAFASVRFDGNVLPVLEGVGYKQVHPDEFGTVAIGIERLGDLRAAYNLPPDEFMRQFGSKIKQSVVRSRKDKREVTGPKYYRGAAVLDELQKAAEATQHVSESLDEVEISPELLDQMGRSFRETYSNEYGQYIFYPSAVEPISPAEVFGSEEYIDLEKLDGVNLNALKDSKTGEVPMFWHDPETVRQRLEHLRTDGQLSLIRKPNSSGLEAFTYGYHGSISEAFDREEWRNPVNYSGFESPKHNRDIAHFVDCINEAAKKNPEIFQDKQPFSEDSQVYIWNQLAVIPSARKQGKMKEVTRNFFEQLKRKSNLPAIGLSEVPVGAPIHKIVRKAGAVDVPGALDIPGKEDGHGITLVAYKLQSFIDHFTDKKGDQILAK